MIFKLLMDVENIHKVTTSIEIPIFKFLLLLCQVMLGLFYTFSYGYAPLVAITIIVPIIVCSVMRYKFLKMKFFAPAIFAGNYSNYKIWKSTLIYMASIGITYISLFIGLAIWMHKIYPDFEKARKDMVDFDGQIFINKRIVYPNETTTNRR